VISNFSQQTDRSYKVLQPTNGKRLRSKTTVTETKYGILEREDSGNDDADRQAHKFARLQNSVDTSFAPRSSGPSFTSLQRGSVCLQHYGLRTINVTDTVAGRKRKAAHQDEHKKARRPRPPIPGNADNPIAAFDRIRIARLGPGLPG
jgi:hypothetical protein